MRTRPRLALLLGCVFLVGSFGKTPLFAGDPEFRRGDVTNNGSVAIGDAIALLAYLFQGGSIPCRDAADFDDSGTLSIADPIALLSYLFSGGPPPTAPGPFTCGVDPTLDTLECLSPPCGGTDELRLRAGHLLSRAAFGARPGQVDEVLLAGQSNWLDDQFIGVDDGANAELVSRLLPLVETFDRNLETVLLGESTIFRYRKGDSPYPANWQDPGFDDSSWEFGPSPLRYSFGSTGTLLSDMQGGYTSIAGRATFHVENPAAVSGVSVLCDYDDGFVAYVNGVEVARSNVVGTPPAHDAIASSSHGAGLGEYFSFSPSLLVAGENTFAIQGFNRNINNGDFYLEPRVIQQEPIPGAPPKTMTRDQESLQRMPFLHARYSENDLQSVLGLFWDNHFTTDYDKVRDYIRNRRDRFNIRTIGSIQSTREAASLEANEYQFFRDNAFGNFGDLLLYSATSPTMLIYLDSVLNLAAEPNENYAREILELFGLGVDNGYTQTDVEEVSRCFTGWTVEKVPYASTQPFPLSATNPVTEAPDETIDNDWIAVGEVWKYLPGTAEPTPGAGGVATTAWTELGFDDSSWASGPTGIGFGDGDDATVINGMQGNYVSLYFRKTFTVTDVNEPGYLELDLRYDDGAVVYLNGSEVARASQMNGTGTPPPFDALSGGHEVTSLPLRVSLDPYRSLLQTGDNVLAVQVHNSSLSSNDISFIPRLFVWNPSPGYQELESRQGDWVFRFNPDEHDTGPKTIFAGTPYELQIPGGRLGADGVLDGLDVIERITEHPSTAEFISVKLIGLLVSDEIDLASAHDLSAPLELRALLADAIAAWYSTSPPGDIETVVRAILDIDDPAGTFMGSIARSAKVKTPFEHIASTLRALEVDITGGLLVSRMEDMGQHFFDRDEPDGWPERGDQWIGTTTLLERIYFVNEVVTTNSSSLDWDPVPFIQAAGAVSAADIIDLFDDLLYHGTLNASERLLLLRYAEVQPGGAIVPFDPSSGDYDERVERLIGMLLSMPRFNFQ